MKRTRQLRQQYRRIMYKLLKAKIKKAYWNLDSFWPFVIVTVIFFMIIAFIFLKQ